MKIKQGAVIVNGYIVVKHYDDLDCIEFDLSSKYADVVQSHIYNKDHQVVPCLIFSAVEDTLHLDLSYDRDIATIVELDEYEGYEIFSCSGPFRYTCRLVLMRDVTINAIG